MARTPGEVIVARLKAAGKLPPVPAKLVRGPSRSHGPAWLVEAAGARVGSHHPAKAIAAARRWRFRETDDLVLVEPEEPD